jgi:hypothetical protein
MMHREEFRKSSQSQESEDKTADEVTTSDRCAIPREIFNEVAVLASASKKTNCEVQVEVLRGWTELKKLQNECAQPQAQSGMIDANMLILNSAFLLFCMYYKPC